MAILDKAKIFLTKQQGNLACLPIENDKGELGYETLHLFKA